MLSQSPCRQYPTEMSCLELTIVRQELSGNLFVSQSITLFYKPRNHFLGRAERANAIIEDCSAK